MEKWKESQISKAIELHGVGKSFKEISVELNRTEKAIKEKLKHYGLKQNVVDYRVDIVCEKCGKLFNSFINENRKYCSQSCAATVNNIKYPKRVKLIKIITNPIKNNGWLLQPEKHCYNCGNLLKNSKHKFCSRTCHTEYKRTQIFNAIENDTYNNDNQNRWHKKYLIDKHGEKCMECNWHEINQYSNKIPIELEHIDGNSKNNKLNNLKLLCPNCHSLTPTYRALNKGNGRHCRMKRYNDGKSF